MTKQLQDFDTPLDLGVIYASIDNEGFSEQTLQLIEEHYTQWKNRPYLIQSTGACGSLLRR